MAGLTGADAPSWVPPIPASLGAKRAAGVPKSRPLSLVGRENTPGSAEIAPNRSTPVRNPSALRPTSANICRRWRPMEMNRANQVPGMADFIARRQRSDVRLTAFETDRGIPTPAMGDGPTRLPVR